MGNAINLDSPDRRMLAIIQADGRITNAALAERVNLSPSACLRRLRRLEEAGVIEAYTARLNRRAVGRACEVFIEVTLASQSEERLSAFEQAVSECAAVLECHLMSGDADYLLRVLAADPADYERVHSRYLSRLPGVARIRSNFALRTVCRRDAIDLEA